MPILFNLMLSYFDTHSHQPYQLKSTHLTQLIVDTHISDLSIAFPRQKNCPTETLFAKGLHPWFVSEFSNLPLNIQNFTQAEIAAIGEIGLDFSKDYLSTKSLQIAVFEQQLKFAQYLNLPVSIHCRLAFPELLDCLKRFPVTGAIHGFMGSVEQAAAFIKLGFKLGVNGIVCNPNAPRYHRLVREIPLQNLVLESDYPFISNQHKQPILVDAVAKKIAELLMIPLDEVASITYDTASTVFVRNSHETII